MADLITMLSAAAGAGGEYQISRSLRFNSADTTYLNRTPASASNRKTWTWSGWVKRSSLNTFQYFFNASPDSFNNTFSIASFGAGASEDQLRFIEFQGGSQVCSLRTTQVFRDVSAWYHIVLAADTTQATDTNRFKMYVNGVQITAFSVASYPAQNADLTINNNVLTTIGYITTTNNFNGYMTEVNFIDGQALTPSSFGEINPDTGVWQPKKYAGTYGTNGFYLNFSDNSNTTASTLGKDYSGNGNNWTPNNFSVTAGAGNDSLVDTPTPYGTDTGAGGTVRGNYATLNALNNTTTLSNGNLQSVSTADDWYPTVATFGMSSGKWYWEIVMTAQTAYIMIGIVPPTFRAAVSTYPGVVTGTGIGYFNDDGDLFTNGNGSRVSYGAGYTVNDVIGVALDMDAGTLTFYKNGVSQGTAATGLTGTYLPAFGNYQVTAVANFGQRPFAYTAPSGFKALVTTNLPDPTIVQGDDYFNTVLYTGTGSSQSITGVGFQPDFVWIKERNGAADHGLYDAVRGVQQQLESNTTTDETTESTGLTAFGTNGFTVGSLAQLNTNNDTYVAWNWKESTTSKFDIVTYTGNGTARTISHNLGVVPNMIIVKARTTASTDQGWPVYHSANTANPETDYLLLNSIAATADLDTVWNDTAPTSSVFSVGTNALVNANNDTYVAYCFAEVPGYSKFGSYTGNGSTDGTFVFCGFRPRWIMFKRSSTTGFWYIFDTVRGSYNCLTPELYPNDPGAEPVTARMDILSNGFKCRTTEADINGSGSTMIFAAFAENPVKFSLAR